LAELGPPVCLRTEGVGCKDNKPGRAAADPGRPTAGARQTPAAEPIGHVLELVTPDVFWELVTKRRRRIY
jgi:hypothetical protein